MTKKSHTFHNVSPKVAIVMGSASDWEQMKLASQILSDLEVSHIVDIVSAHRSPDKMFEFAENADSKGFEVIIAGAGGAAHLPGMIASKTLVPVIGVPIKNGPLNGEDALLSIVQMPKGVPVASVGIGNATNAGLLAAQMLATQDTELKTRVAQWREKRREEALAAELN